MSNQLVAFTLDDQTYALRLKNVDRVVRTVEVRPLPRAPGIVLGIINVGGKLIATVDLRARLGLRPYEVSASGQLILAHTPLRALALPVDSVVGVVERSDGEVTPATDIVPRTGYLDGVAKLDDGLMFIHDLDRFLSLDEERALFEALAQNRESVA